MPRSYHRPPIFQPNKVAYPLFAADIGCWWVNRQDVTVLEIDLEPASLSPGQNLLSMTAQGRCTGTATVRHIGISVQYPWRRSPETHNNCV